MRGAVVRKKGSPSGHQPPAVWVGDEERRERLPAVNGAAHQRPSNEPGIHGGRGVMRPVIDVGARGGVMNAKPPLGGPRPPSKPSRQPSGANGVVNGMSQEQMRAAAAEAAKRIAEANAKKVMMGGG
eukprot:CAMPEP_0169429430 /NCGR_PEP_ID=MMETSP1042-20121227/1861_1 /TAXON_ID=464988 /ORGANISM="Hemiselmis andersenii, Strain CCMP1180" /LENGTH=126 /DNA_ID=CAMNT_0009539677 /DNA_START=10 /DNA_END=386 /DNA_ORIENTATION=-